MPSASNNNQSNTKLVKQTSVNSVNSGGASGTSSGSGGKGNKKITENSTKSNIATVTSSTTTTTTNNETSSSSIKSSKENTSNVASAGGSQQPQQSSSKNWETASATGNAAASTSLNKDAGNDALNPMKLTFTTIEHKIRNLEKRKTKLEGYRAIQASGKELSGDQRTAVAKYDAVLATLDFARDLVKQMQQFTKDAEKEQKKQARKELIAKAQAETIKIREVLIIQNILSCFTDEAVRNDFLAGENGAAKLEPNEFDILEKFCLDVQTRRPETSEDVPFATTAQKAAEIFSMTIDARPKQYGESTYENVKRIFHRIQESDYLDKIYLTDVPEEAEIKISEDELTEVTATNANTNNEMMMESAEEVMLSQEQEITNLEEGMEKMHIDSGANQPVEAGEVPLDNGLVGQQQQQILVKEHHIVDIQQQQHQQVVAHGNLPAQAGGQPLMNAPPMAPPATAVPSFQPAAQAAHSGATTPVHVAMYHPSMQQPTPQQLQQLPHGGVLIGGVPQNVAGQIIAAIPAQQQGVQNPQQPPPPQQQQTAGQVNQQQQQRQMLTSPAGGQPQAAPLQQQPPPPQGHFNPTPVHAVEQTFFKHPPPHPAHPQQQYMQQMRPLAEVIGSGNFYFLQDSELDSPDLNNQGQQQQQQPQNTLVFEQQQQQQQPPSMQNPPQKSTQNLMNEQQAQAAGATANQQQLQQAANQLPPQQQQQPPQHPQQQPTQTPIQTQTFTNQSFPQMPPPTQQQQQASLINSNTPSPLFQQQQPPQQQQQAQKQPTNQQQQQQQQQQLFSPVQGENIQNQPFQMMLAKAQQQQQQQQPTLMMMNRMAGGNNGPPPSTPLMQQQQQQALLQQQQQHQIAPQTQNLVGGMQQLPNPSVAADLNQAPKNVGFPYESSVVSGLTSYEQQMQSQLGSAANVLKNSLTSVEEPKPVTPQNNQNDLINEWDESVLNSASTGDFKSPSSNAGATVQVESNKWSAEVNANSPITVQQTQTRKNEWTATSSTATNVAGNEPAVTGSYGNDNRTESNHWHSQDAGGYGRGAGGGNRGQGYQRRNDDRRDDRRPPREGTGGGGSGGGYRGRSNYGSGNPQQNGQTRGGGGGGIYFRNNENTNANSYYQNGSGGGGGAGAGGSNVYSNKDNTGGSRYDSRGGGGGYRGPRGPDNNSANPRSNGPPPRHMGNRAGGGGGGNANPANTNSNSYMNSRQSSNRMPLGLENKN